MLDVSAPFIPTTVSVMPPSSVTIFMAAQNSRLILPSRAEYFAITGFSANKFMRCLAVPVIVILVVKNRVVNGADVFAVRIHFRRRHMFIFRQRKVTSSHEVMKPI